MIVNLFGNVWDVLPMPALLLEIGFVLLAIALFWFARVLGELLEIIQKPPLEGLVKIAGWLLIITFAIPHYIANAIFKPNLTADQGLWYWLWSFRTLSFIGALVAATLAIIPAIQYWRWTSK
jgi:hypothetical protein